MTDSKMTDTQMTETQNSQDVNTDKKMTLGAKFAYTFGAFGHDMFYAALSTYLINFITSNLFKTGDTGLDNVLVGVVTTIIMLLRIVELIIDPFIGNAIDRTKTRWGKFRPWVVIGGAISSIILLVLFTQMGGLSKTNPWLYLVIFTLLYIIMDVFFSFNDIGFWSMLPALSFDTREREKTATMARVGAALGSAAVGIIVMPVVLFFSLEGAGEAGDPNGWLVFGVLVAAIGLISAVGVGLFTRENDNALRENKEETKGVVSILKALVKNDQLMWTAVAYICYCVGCYSVNALELYYFQYIQGAPEGFVIAQSGHMVIGVIAVLLFPPLTKKLKRKPLYVVCMCSLIVGLILFGVAPVDLSAESISPLVWVADVLFFAPQQVIFLIVLMTITDSVEYGQWKTGHRDESLSLSVRPMCDKFGGAVANGVVGQTAILACMTSGATAASVAEAGTAGLFKIIMVVIPIILLVASIIIFTKKVVLDEKKHAQIMKELKETWNK